MLKIVVIDYVSFVYIFFGNNIKYYYYVIDFLWLFILIYVVVFINDI